MAFNGLGVFNRLYNWVTDRNLGIKILASRMDAEMDGFATGLSTCITKDGQQTLTADIPFSNFKITLLASGISVTDAANIGQLRSASAEYASAGSVDNYTAGFSPTLTAVSTGMALNVYFGRTNVGGSTATFNPDGLGASPLVGANGSAITAAGGIKVGMGRVVRYGTSWYYTPPSSPAGLFGLTDGGVIAYNATGGTVQNNTSYLVNATSTVQVVNLSASPSTGDAVALTIYGTSNVKLWASGLLIYGNTATVETLGNEGLAIPRYTGTTRGWVW